MMQMNKIMRIAEKLAKPIMQMNKPLSRHIASPQGDRGSPRAQLGEVTDSERSGPPQGDRKGPHPTPHHPRPYYEDESRVTRRGS